MEKYRSCVTRSINWLCTKCIAVQNSIITFLQALLIDHLSWGKKYAVLEDLKEISNGMAWNIKNYWNSHGKIIKEITFFIPGKNGSDALTGLDVHKELGTLLSLLQDDAWTDYLLYVSSALFLHPEIQLKLSYKHALSDIYKVNVFRTNFSYVFSLISLVYLGNCTHSHYLRRQCIEKNFTLPEKVCSYN